MLKSIHNETKDRMEKTLESTKGEMAKVRTGRANPAVLDSIKIDYYGNPSPIKQVANVGVPEPRMITIQPWDKSMLGEIERAILKADIGITPSNDGNIIRLPVPALTEDTRKDLVKVVHQMGEEGKVAVRNIRRDAIDQLKKAQKDSHISEDEEYNGGIDIQELTDEYVKKIDEVVKSKETEIMEV